MTRLRSRRLATWLLVASWVTTCTAHAATNPYEPYDAEVGGSLAWVADDDLDLVGTLHVELPLAINGSWTGFGRIHMTTAIERAASDFEFLVREIDHRVEIGARHRIPGGTWGVLAGQVGRNAVDLPGSPWVRYLGAEIAAGSSGRLFTGLVGNRPRWIGTAAIAAVVDDHDIDADAVVRAAIHYRRPWRRIEVGFDVELDGLGSFADGGSFDADVRGGPRVGIGRRGPGGAARYDLFAHLLRGRNPFGLRLDGAIVGLDIASRGRSTSTGSSWWRFVEAGGAIAAGAGDRDGAVRLSLWFDSPEFWSGWHATVTMDPNVVTGDDVDELYWSYHVGAQRRRGPFLAGIWFYHRSNHTWSDVNPSGVTSLDVVEIGADSEGWDRAGGLPAAGGGWGRLDVRVRAGYLVDSSFGQDRDWHVRLGVRWSAPFRIARSRPFVEIQREDGDVARSAAAIGIGHDSGLSGRVEWRRDDQWFGADHDAVLGLVGVAF